MRGGGGVFFERADLWVTVVGHRWDKSRLIGIKLRREMRDAFEFLAGPVRYLRVFDV